MARTVKFSEIREASPALREAALAGIIAQAKAPANGGLESLSSQIAGYESKYGLTSEELLEELSSGRREETEDVLSWLMLIRLKERVDRTRTV